jgi:hypothetical protein
MRALRNSAVGLLMTFGMIRTVEAQGLAPVQTGTAAPQVPLGATNGSGTISGHARTPSKGRAFRTRVQLRDIQSGRVIAGSTTDQSGSFSFANVQPGTYIVEVVGENEAVLAVSSVLSLHAGEALAVAISVPVVAAGAGGIGSTAATAGVVAASAAAAGVLAIRKVGDPTCPQ